MTRPYDLSPVANPQLFGQQIRERFVPLLHAGQGHEHPATSLRVVEYRGRRIEIETSYRITVDGEPVTGHVQVGTDGHVHYHPIPNEDFASAVDVVKRIIDLTPAATPQPVPDHHH